MAFARAGLVSLALVVSCTGKPEGSGGSGERSSANGRVERSDAQLANYLAWQVKVRRVVASHRTAQETVVQRIAGRSPGQSAAIEHDSELLALLQRQREDMQRLMASAPTGPTAIAIGETLSGIGTQMPGQDGMTLLYVARRDESVLHASRAKYGTAFVSWLLAQEGMINATLGADQ